MTQRYLLVWDLDNTLGQFDELAHRHESTEPITVHVRPDLRAALETLSQEGFVHTLLTLATPLYAEVILASLALRDLFARVDGFGQRGKGDAAGLSHEFGIPEAQRGDRMLFIGDNPLHDVPQDPRVVFHLECFGLQRSARDAAAMIFELRAQGNGSLRDGFERVCQEPGWRRLLRRAAPFNTPLQRSLPGLDPCLLVRREHEAPVIAFASPPAVVQPAVAHAFIPAMVTPTARAQLRRLADSPGTHTHKA